MKNWWSSSVPQSEPPGSDDEANPSFAGRLEKRPSSRHDNVSRAEDWSLMPHVKHQRDRDAASRFKRRELGVTWKNLCVEVVSTAEAAVNENALSQFNIHQHVKGLRDKPARRSVLQNSHGCVKPGEML